jgi:hypothetical protein
MKKRIGRFIFDVVVKYIDYLDDEHYDVLRAKTYRPAWAKTRTFTYHPIHPLKPEGENPVGPRFL